MPRCLPGFLLESREIARRKRTRDRPVAVRTAGKEEPKMKIAVIDDYQNAFPTLECARKLSGHELIVYTDTEKDPERLARRLQDADAVILTQQRSRFPRGVIE